MECLLAERPLLPKQCLLPILGDKNNTVRVDFLVAITRHNIYRDIWERHPPTKDEFLYWGRAPRSELDYPEERALMLLANSLPLSHEILESENEGSNPILDSSLDRYGATRQ